MHWTNRHIFRDDVDQLGGLEKVSKQYQLLLSTLTDYYNGTRTPHYMSRPSLALALGFAPNRYN